MPFMRTYWYAGSEKGDVIRFNQRIELNNILSWNTITMDLNKCVISSESKNVAPLRLKGGGESSISNGTSAWGTPQSSNHNNGKGTNASQSTSSENTVWGQIGSKSEANNVTPPSSQVGGSPSNTQNNNGSATSTKQQLEQLQSLRDAIFSQDGWGVQFVNQNTNWDIPSSPEPPNKIEGTNGSGSWKPPVNNGTELWEANLRNGGQPPQKPVWGHTPSNNIGGTWGENDESDTSNVWAGGNSSQQHWSSNGNTNSTAWNGPKKDDWSANNNNNNSLQEPRVPDPRQMGADPREICPGNRGATNSETIRLLDHRELMRQMPNDVRGDPRGITGRLNGAVSEAYWGQPSHIAAQSHHKMSAPPNGPGWNEATTISQTRNSPNHDDGASLWGNSQQGSQWKDLPTTGLMGRNGAPPSTFNLTQARIKSEPLGNGRNGSWDEIGNQSVGWDEQNVWTKPKVPNHMWENEQDWNQKSNKLHLTKEVIWNSKQFRMLVDMGHKKEDVENALRLRDMNLDEALDLLNTLRRVDNWGNRHDDHFEPVALGNQKYSLGPNVPLTNFPSSNSDSNVINGLSNPANINNSLLNNVSSAYVQKMLLQGIVPQGLGGNPSIPNRNLQSQPTSQQLKLLVGQIQMAVQAGFLNNQILNQPLAPQTLALLNQLLQQIKTLQQLVAQQNVLSTYSANGKANNAYMQYSVLIAKTKQAIVNIQNQISTQQVSYLKQQMGDVLKSNMMHDSIGALQNNFVDLGISKEPVAQSKLNQWIKKDKDGSEFSRAPGSKSKLSGHGHLGMTNDGPWSNRRSTDVNWPNSTEESANGNDTQWSTLSQSSITDLVPEFEPGKPWKGNQIKSIEDDPTITPGSVVRSPLSIPTIKDSWSNIPQTATSKPFLSNTAKLQTSDNGLSESNTTTAPTLDLWSVPKQSNSTSGFPSDNWSNPITNASWGSNHPSSSGNWSGSTWLLLRNLTAQIDGSTLRTLCMQHGPLMSFNLHLYQGFALAKYPSREEATKAQTALNNCVLGNTTILAENPSDWDANALLQQLANQQNNSSGNWRGSSKQNSTDSWNSGWPNNASSNPWPVPLDCNDMRATPSNLNSFLPNDLLGESI